jgi:alpha-tubulin suppressor-like RCC1 family protein
VSAVTRCACWTLRRLGTGQSSGNLLQPVPVFGGLQGVHAVSAAAGGAHTVVLSACGQVYAFGRHGVNGIDGERDVLEPEQVVLPVEAGGAIQVSASWFYTLVSTRSGYVYEFGGQRYGEASQATPSRLVRLTCTTLPSLAPL